MRFLSETEKENCVQNNLQGIKNSNVKRIFDLLYANGQLSRADIKRLTGLSATTVSSLVDLLIAAGYVQETGLVKLTTAGRKPIRLEIYKDGVHIPAFSFNRWGVRYTLYNLGMDELESFFITHRTDQYERVDENGMQDPDAGSDYADIIRNVLLHQSKVLDLNKTACICISQPGLYVESQDLITCSALKVNIRGETFSKLEEELHIPILLGNSSMAYAYAEVQHRNCIGENMHDLIYLNVADGIGSGIVYNDKIFTGPNNTAGELGNILINTSQDPNGMPVALEEAVSIQHIVSEVKNAVTQTGCFELMECTNDPFANVSLELIGDAYARKIEPVKQIIDLFANQLYVGIHNAICITGIRQIVIGGGIERLGEAFLNRLKENHVHFSHGFLTEDISLSYPTSGQKGDSIGIVCYFINKEFLN